MQKGPREKGAEAWSRGGGGRVMTCGLVLMHVLSLPRTFTLPVPHPDHGLPLSSAELAYTSVPHGVLHGTPPVS